MKTRTYLALAAFSALAACGGGGGESAAIPGGGGNASGVSSSAALSSTSSASSTSSSSSTSSTPIVSLPPVPAPPPVAAPPGMGTAEYVPLFDGNTQVVEQIQYREADGTLVTYIGYRPTPRHAKEGGEQFQSLVDQGPGTYLDFPSRYFQNRTFGLVIRDEVPAGRQKITAYLKPSNGIMIENSFNAFRRVDPGVIEYGWKIGTGFKNPKDNSDRCGPADKIEDMCIANTIITDYWRFQDDKTYQGESTRANNKLVIGDKIEVTAGVFLDYVKGTTVALIDGGFNRNYSMENLYVVGKGVVPWYGIAPMLDTTPLPEKTLSGGLASVPYNYSEEPYRMLQQSAANIGASNMQRWVEGRRLFHTSFVDGKHSENVNENPVFTEHISQIGASFNEIRCLGCHTLNARSPAAGVGDVLNKFAVLTAAASDSTSITPDPTYGLNVQQKATTGAGLPVKVASFTASTRTLGDGTLVQLQKPAYTFPAAIPAQFSVRQAPQVVGMGLLEAVDEKTILAFADPNDQNGDGIRGVPNWSIDPVTGAKHLGRFGWKAGKGSIRHQVAGAFMLDMGVTTPLFKTRDCQRGFSTCKTSTATPSINDTEMERITNYIELLGVPAQMSVRSGFTNGWVVPPEHDAIDEAMIERGRQLFLFAQCTGCHIAEMKTGPNHRMQELRDQTIRPYTDLLLHDMGPEMADTMTEGQAGPQLWRTSPLWGLGTLKYAMNPAEDGKPTPENVRYLHDGRARSITEAIGWHGGEGAASRAKFEAMTKVDRDALLLFLGSL
jgi:CxxC motif-containing protein (DUF1111 family)